MCEVRGDGALFRFWEGKRVSVKSEEEDKCARALPRLRPRNLPLDLPHNLSLDSPRCQPLDDSPLGDPPLDDSPLGDPPLPLDDSPLVTRPLTTALSVTRPLTTAPSVTCQSPVPSRVPRLPFVWPPRDFTLARFVTKKVFPEGPPEDPHERPHQEHAFQMLHLRNRHQDRRKPAAPHDQSAQESPTESSFAPEKVASSSSSQVQPLSHFCFVCGKGFKSLYHLQRHVTVHSGASASSYSCSVCGVVMKNSQDLMKHMSQHDADETTDQPQDPDQTADQTADLTTDLTADQIIDQTADLTTAGKSSASVFSAVKTSGPRRTSGVTSESTLEKNLSAVQSVGRASRHDSV
ncbi:hypothetical protein WMY93_019018 [Mugilogobius chulae]|uniref:C2H2-type domain-containing protein n=1 Tax=Mugilogobius chulae TaxID=88201 RepID=A0AAW0NND3_9GOBI